MAWLWHGRGSALHADDDLRAAIADYTRAIALEPDSAHPYLNRGLAHAAEGDDEAAIADYTEAIRLGPADADTYFHRGEARSRAGDDEAAVADFSEAIRLDPGHAKAYRARAASLEALGREDEAEADHDRAERLGDEGPTGGAAMSVTERKAQIHALIQSHFEPTPVEDLTVTERQFPLRVRADLQRAIDAGLRRGDDRLVLLRGPQGALLRGDQLLRAPGPGPQQPRPVGPAALRGDRRRGGSARPLPEERPVAARIGRDEVRRLPGAEHPVPTGSRR